METTPASTAVIRKAADTRAGEAVGAGDPHALWVGTQTAAAPVESGVRGPLKLKRELPYASATTILSIYLKNMKVLNGCVCVYMYVYIYIHTHTHTHTHRCAECTIIYTSRDVEATRVSIHR